MNLKYSISVLVFITVVLLACEDFQLYKNIPVGSHSLSITSITPISGPLRGDTLTIIGGGFNSVPYQNSVNFAAEVDEQHYVNDKGEVTDSIIYVVVKLNSFPAKVVDSTPTSLKVIIPDDAVSGPVLVSYGVDTVTSPIPFTLISTSKRPVITGYDPQFGAPGTQVVMTGVYFAENMVASFGGTLISIPNPGGGSTIEFPVANVFSGPVDLQVGSITEQGDTLWSSSVNFGVLPSPQSVPFIVTTDLNAIVAKAKIIEGQIEISGFTNFQDADNPQGITMSADSSTIYWINKGNVGGQPVCSINRGTVENGNASVQKVTYGSGVVFGDLVLNGNFLYAATNKNIRRFTVAADGGWGTAQVVCTFTGNPSITNLKINGNAFYWIDQTNKKIVKAVLSGSSLTAIEDVYTDLLNPRALTVNPNNGDVYFTDIKPEGSVIYRGNVNSKETPVAFHSEVDYPEGFNDLEIDMVNQFVYWSRGGSFDATINGIYRKTFKTPVAKAELVFQFEAPNYFDF